MYAPYHSKRLRKIINENDNHYFYAYDQRITACYYHVIETKPIAQQHLHTHAALRVCVNALIVKKKQRTEKRRHERVLLDLAWFEL